MKCFAEVRREGAFTLIELLIVVAIIAILAAIAVPNFLEAQTRSKVSRAKADMRSLATAIESYAVDYNLYPPIINHAGYEALCYTYTYYLWTNEGNGYPDEGRALTTPVAYITAFPVDPFLTKGKAGGSGAQYSYSFLNFRGAAKAPKTAGSLGVKDVVESPAPVRLNGPEATPRFTEWALVGMGPDRESAQMQPDGSLAVKYHWVLTSQNRWNRLTVDGGFVQYDSTNGTQSGGDIWYFQGGGD